MHNKNLLIIYKDSKIPDVKEIENLFEIIIIPKIDKKISLKNYKKEGNLLASKYNEIIFSSESENIFFVCSSELKKTTNNLLNFNLETDFSYFADKKTGNLLEFLSGFFIKKAILIKIGCFDKYTFHNLFLNFLINYSRFFSEKDFFLPDIKLNIKDYIRIFFWGHFENCLYCHRLLQKEQYSDINKKFFKKNTLNRIIRYIIPKTINLFYPDINKFIIDNTYTEYW
ncbi:MAG: hypothetical protein M1416_03055 [Candidatus Pacearchaeota archaeon]|nr:hypothetical protein [Candidatus Pacearchaeota archaeon]